MGSTPIRVVDGAGARALAGRLWPCYDAVFGDVEDERAFREDVLGRHAARDGFRLAVAAEEDRVVGFAWGYRGERGQYWSDLVAESLPEVAEIWIGGHFELVELAVLPAARRRGLGRALLDAVLEGVEGRCLLSTSDDPDDPAVRLYRATGWRTLGTLAAGIQVMGREPQTSLTT